MEAIPVSALPSPALRFLHCLLPSEGLVGRGRGWGSRRLGVGGGRTLSFQVFIPDPVSK